MELVSFAKDVIQNVAEQAASYRIGQTALRHIDRALWVVEKCARWAVPPPLDQDEKPQPELVRPLPWVFFLTMLVALRITRESISLINLILGKPPLRSADVVMYIQSKRRYLRTLKYQGNRNIRARRTSTNSQPWYSGVQALFEFTMCFRRSHNYGNNNTTRVSNNDDEVLVVKRNKRTREPAGAVASTSETTMERLIEKMMVQLDADSDDDSSYTLTNATSLKSLRSEESEFDQDSAVENHNSTNLSIDSSSTLIGDATSSTPEKHETGNVESPKEDKKETETEKQDKPQIENGTDKENLPTSKIALSEPNNVDVEASLLENDSSKTGSPVNEKKQIKYSPKETTNNFLQSERCSPQKQTSKQTKFGRKISLAFSKNFSSRDERTEALANGRAMSVPSKKKGLTNQRRDSDTPVMRHSATNDSF